MRIALDKTKQCNVLEYASGDRLEDLVDGWEAGYPLLMQVVDKAGYKISWAERMQRWKQVRQGRQVIRLLKVKGIYKAVCLCLFARNALVWVVLRIFATSGTAPVRATKLIYRARVMESLAHMVPCFGKTPRPWYSWKQLKPCWVCWRPSLVC